MQNEMALQALEVSVTNTRRPHTTHNMCKAWLSMTLELHEAAIGQVDECPGSMYFNSDKELVSFTIVLRPCVQNNQADWLISQQGNHLDKGRVAVKIRINDLCGSAVVLMRELFTKLLKLTYNTTLIVDKANITFEDNC